MNGQDTGSIKFLKFYSIIEARPCLDVAVAMSRPRAS